jgi:multidrug resistance efflux pump
MKARWIVVPTLVLVLAAGGAAAWTRTGRPTARVEPATLTERLIARAEVVAVDGVAEVRARTDGRVLRVHVREGDRVTAGQILAEIEGDSLQAEVRRRQAEQSALAASASAIAAPARDDERTLAEAEAEAARQELTLARDRAARIERLHGTGSATDSESLAARANADIASERVRMAEARVRMMRRGGRRQDVRAARARARAAEAAVTLAERDLDRTRLVAPVAGVVLARRIDPGDTVTLVPGASEVLFEIADPSHVEVRAEVEEIDAPRVQVGMHATVTLAGASETLSEGAVARISPKLERRRVGAEDVRVRAEGVVRMVWITPTRGDALALGQRLDAHLEFNPRRAEATVPRSAVRVADGRAIVSMPLYAGLWSDERVVRLGIADAHRVEVHGLSAGTVVELHTSE